MKINLLTGFIVNGFRIGYCFNKFKIETTDEIVSVVCVAASAFLLMEEKSIPDKEFNTFVTEEVEMVSLDPNTVPFANP